MSDDLTPPETPAAKVGHVTDDSRVVAALESIARSFATMAAASIDNATRFDALVSAVEDIPIRMAERNAHERSGVK
jgi:hypothetical protein